MTMPTPSYNTSQYGALTGDYPRSNQIYLAIGAGIVALLIALMGGATFSSTSRLLIAALGGVLLVRAYLDFGSHVQLFERGFIITGRLGKITSGRWEDIASVTSQNRQTYLFSLIPIPGTVKTEYSLTMLNGEKVAIYHANYTNADQIGALIAQKWTQANTAKLNSPKF